jgi:hypothetical protein
MSETFNFTYEYQINQPKAPFSIVCLRNNVSIIRFLFENTSCKKVLPHNDIREFYIKISPIFSKLESELDSYFFMNFKIFYEFNKSL